MKYDVNAPVISPTTPAIAATHLDMVAKKLGCDASDLKQISAQFGRIGQQWINIAGASSGAWLGLFICITATCGVVAYKKKKGNKQVVKE